MSFKKQLLIIFSSIFILLASGLVTFYNILKNEKEIANAEFKRYESYLLADELRQSSDDLTRMARTYTVTANPRFRKYFNRILDIRDGKTSRPAGYSGIYWDFVTATGIYPSSPADEKVSLESLMKNMNFTRDEFHLLQEAKNNSDTLVHLENQAMNAMAGLYPNEEGDFIIRKKPDPILAQTIMHSPEYHKAKKNIMKPMQVFFQKVDARTTQTVAFYKNKGARLNTLMLSFTCLAIILIFISSVLIFFQGRQKKTSLQAWKTADNWKRKTVFILKSWPIFILATVAFAINLSFFWWINKTIEEQVYADLKAELEIIIDTTYNGSVQWLKETEHKLESFIFVSSIADKYKNRTSIDQQNLHRFFRKDLDDLIHLYEYKNYFLLDKKGKVLSSSQEALIGKSVFNSIPKKLISQLKGPKNTALVFPESRNEQKDNPFNKNILLAGSITNEEDSGFLIVELPLVGGFSDIIQKGRFKKSGESYVFNSEGYLLSESRFNDQLYEIGLLPQGANSSLAIRVVDPGVNLTLHPKKSINLAQKDLTQMVLNAFQGQRGVNLKSYNDYRGVPVIGSWIWDSEYNIGWSTEIDSDEAFSTLQLFEKQAHSQLIISLILLLTLTIVFVWNKALFAEVNDKLQLAYKAIKIHTDRMEEELKVGQQIQMSMVPRRFPEHDKFSIHAQLRPARELAGDFYDFFLLDEHRLCLVIGDVSGKGVPSALFMAVAKTLIRSSAFKHKYTNKIISEVNKNISLNNPYCMFATIFIAILNLSTGECDYTSAGHHSSYVKKQNGQLIALDQIHGPVAGAVDDVVFLKDNVTLEKGDLILAYTDGITEAADEKNNLYGEERLTNLLEQKNFASAGDLIDEILNSVAEFSKNSSQSDDITLISAKYFG